MDTGTVLVILILAVVIIAVSLLFRQKIHIRLARFLTIAAINPTPTEHPHPIGIDADRIKSGGHLNIDSEGGMIKSKGMKSRKNLKISYKQSVQPENHQESRVVPKK